MDSSIQDSTPYASDLDVSQASRPGRKRTRDLSKEDALDDQFDTNDDGRPKTRRVNPQRLAIRLGPDLVAEMEALIIPGAKMPTFSVRKDFQERYCVDRRHIYDYFHSRGLRVSKEDKHTNLIRGRAMKAAAAAAAAAAALPPVPFSKATSPDVRSVMNNSAVESNKPKNKQPLRAYKKKKTDILKPRRSFLASPSGNASRESTLSPISEPSFSLHSNSPGGSSSNVQGTSEYSISDEQSMISTPRHNTPAPTICSSKDEPFDYMPLPSAIESPLSPLVAGHAGIMDSEYFSLCLDTDIQHSNDGSLDKSERTDLYNLIQNSLDPGTMFGNYSDPYDFYMKDWTPLSDRPATLNPVVPHYRPSKDLQANGFVLDYSSAVYSGEIPPELFDLRSWLSEDLTREDGQSSQSTHPNTTSTGPSLGTRPVYLGKYDEHPEPGQTNIREHVLHSRAQTRVRTASCRGQI